VFVLDILPGLVFVVRMTCGSSEGGESFIVINVVTVSADMRLMDVRTILSDYAFTNVCIIKLC
jgi:CBS domain-containing protein